MLVTLLGMVTLIKPEQIEKAISPILFTLLGISILVKYLQPAKAPAAIPVTLFGIVKDASIFPAGYTINSVLPLLYKTPFTEE